MYVIAQVHTVMQNNPLWNPAGSFLVVLDWFYMPRNATEIPPADEWNYNDIYALSADDPYGMSPQLRQWMVDNPDFPILPFNPAIFDNY
jgi:hypothetical protein